MTTKVVLFRRRVINPGVSEASTEGVLMAIAWEPAK
jgi:hypothetical protein